MAADGVSVIIRVRDEAEELRRCLRQLSDQRTRRPVEVVVVDAGSRDGTQQVAVDRGARLVAAPSGPFSFGGALNAGAAAASHPVLVALSAHVRLPDDGWLERIVSALTGNAEAACAAGDRYGPEGEPLRSAVVQDAALARRRPEWGYANGAGAFRADLWARRPFRADLPACEDKEWALHWLDDGYTCIVDPALAVGHDHAHDPLRAIFHRARRESAAYAAFLTQAPGPRTAAGLAAAWWSDTRWYDSAAKARLSHRRAARLLGAYVGARPTGARP